MNVLTITTRDASSKYNLYTPFDVNLKSDNPAALQDRNKIRSVLLAFIEYECKTNAAKQKVFKQYDHSESSDSSDEDYSTKADRIHEVFKSVQRENNIEVYHMESY